MGKFSLFAGLVRHQHLLPVLVELPVPVLGLGEEGHLLLLLARPGVVPRHQRGLGWGLAPITEGSKMEFENKPLLIWPSRTPRFICKRF